MKHHSPNDFVATPDRGRGRDTEAKMAKRLAKAFDPVHRARADAQRTDGDPKVFAEAFATEVDQSRCEHLAVSRSEAFAVLTANIDTLGALSVTARPGEVEHLVRDAETRLDQISAEQRKTAESSKAVWAQAMASFVAWADTVGAKTRTAPWPSLHGFVLAVAVVSLVEAWVISTVLAGPPIIGVPTPFVLGLIFAGGSIAVGLLLALGHMLAADARDAFRFTGWVVLALAFFMWGFLALTGAHMRAVIEEGGSGLVPEIMASMGEHLFAPLLSPLALLLVAASFVTSVAVWVKAVGYLGAPLGHRKKDEERRWAVAHIHAAEEGHKAEIKTAVQASIVDLNQLEAAAWKPANDATRLEREVVLIVTQAKESERAIQRSHSALLMSYGNTFRRVSPTAHIGDVLLLGPLTDQAVGDPKALHAQVEVLEAAAAEVSDAVGQAKVRLRASELLHLNRVDAMYAETRRRPVKAPAPGGPTLLQS